ncbi:MAG: glucose-1-phosphate adenylyltransferase subunit GlgD [Clostridiales bacterium]|jgi:glucose-1-phosphate adenylyltransferase|nr:glucose-1-phosphate adenylyltransferase subunit GlgD [Clostridiales bacterium]
MKAVGIVFSNIHDKEIKELTALRTLASVPFGGRFRLIDFVLSNMVNSGISKVGVITKRNYQSLMDHIGSGKSWDLSRKRGGLIVLPPYGVSGTTLYQSRFEAIKNTEAFLRRSDEDYVVMSDCDNVCNFDFSRATDFHIEKNADITVVYRKKDIAAAERKPRTAFTLDGGRRVIKVENSDRMSGKKLVYTNMLIVDRRFLLSIVESAEENGFKSFSSDILTRTSDFRIYGYELEGYFASIDGVSNYYKHSMELLRPENRAALFKPDASIYTKVRDSAPCRLEASARVSDSLIADGCVIEGEVTGSILFRGVRVEKGAKIENSIIFQDTYVGADSRLNCVIADKQARILANRTLSGHETQPYFIAKGSII